MPKQTKLHKIHAEVAGIVGANCSVSHVIRTFTGGKTVEIYEIYDSQNEINKRNFEASTLEEVFQKFKESRGL